MSSRPSPPRRRWLTLSEAAAAIGVTDDELVSMIATATCPAPGRFTQTGPRWDATAVTKFVEGTHPAFTTSTGTAGRERWLARLFDEVCWWVWQHGTARVPTAADGRRVGVQASRLGPRVTKLRATYRRGGLPRRTVAMFESLPGWTWDGREAAWQDRLDDVLTRWPGRLTAEDCAWLSTQRSLLPGMSAARVDALRRAPGLLEHRGNRAVDAFVEAVRAWLSEHPGMTAADLSYGSTVCVRGRLVAVGRRAVYYRRRYLGKESRAALTPSEVARIETLPGWAWEQSSQHVRAARSVKRSRPHAG